MPWSKEAAERKRIKMGETSSIIWSIDRDHEVQSIISRLWESMMNFIGSMGDTGIEPVTPTVSR